MSAIEYELGLGPLDRGTIPGLIEACIDCPVLVDLDPDADLSSQIQDNSAVVMPTPEDPSNVDAWQMRPNPKLPNPPNYEEGVVRERVEYTYEPDNRPWAGNPIAVTRHMTDDPTVYASELVYTLGGELWIQVEHEWEEDDQGNPINKRMTHITEYRGNGRSRYMERQRDPLDPDSVLPDTTTWMDYEGDQPYGEYIVVGDPQNPQVIDGDAFELGLGEIRNGQPFYIHADHLGTTRLITGPMGEAEHGMTFTAFGEPITDNDGTRYGYAGAWGYEQLSELHEGASANAPSATWLHVGHRTYDPTTGRFLERDPIGIRGGLNAYEYVFSLPTRGVDPEGLNPMLKGLLKILPKVAKAGGCGMLLNVWDEIHAWYRFLKNPPKPDPQKSLFENTIEATNNLSLFSRWWLKGAFYLGEGYYQSKKKPGPLVWCFVEGTKVHTEGGLKAIESVTEGDLVASHDANASASVFNVVLFPIVGKTSSTIRIQVGGETLECSPSHRFYVSEGMWQRADELAPGMKLLDMNGACHRIDCVDRRIYDYPIYVYNIEVSVHHNYYVGDRGFLVHNAK